MVKLTNPSQLLQIGVTKAQLQEYHAILGKFLEEPGKGKKEAPKPAKAPKAPKAKEEKPAEETKPSPEPNTKESTKQAD